MNKEILRTLKKCLFCNKGISGEPIPVTIKDKKRYICEECNENKSWVY